MTATIVDLRPSRRVELPGRSREQRREALERLAGGPRHPDDTSDLLAANASHRLTAGKRALLWQAWLKECDRDLDFQAGSPDRFDLQPWDAARRAEVALADLLDGTDLYATEGEL